MPDLHRCPTNLLTLICQAKPLGEVQCFLILVKLNFLPLPLLKLQLNSNWINYGTQLIGRTISIVFKISIRVGANNDKIIKNKKIFM